MKNKIIISLIIMFFLLCIIPFNDIVTSTFTNHLESFEGGISGTSLLYYQSVDNIIQSHPAKGYFNVSSGGHKTGSLSFQTTTNALFGSGWLNFSYSKSLYLINFSTYFYQNNGQWYNIYFYNNTHDGHNISKTNISYSPCIIAIKINSNTISYWDNTGTLHSCGSITGNNWLENFHINITNYNTGSVDFRSYGDSLYHNIAHKPNELASGFRIDRCFIESMNDNSITYWDDMILGINGTVYTPPPPVNTSSCDLSYENDLWVGTGLSNCIGTTTLKVSPISYGNFVEFGNNVPISGTVSGVELAISMNMYNRDKNLSHYILYLNGIYIGSPCGCQGFISGNTALDKFEWVINQPISNSSITFELYNNYYGYGWILPYNADNTNVYGAILLNCHMFYSATSHINGHIDYNISSNSFQPMWEVFFTSINSSGGNNPNYSNSLDVTGNGLNQTGNMQWVYKYDTIWFDTHVNDTIYNYSLHLFKNKIETGQNEFYPIDINSYEQLNSFSPQSLGLFNITLMRGNTIIINKKFWVVNNTILQYKISTYPNPSFQNNQYTVFVYINDNNLFNRYSARVFIYSADTYEYSKAFGGSIIGSLTSDTFSFIFSHNLGTVDYHYWRIFGSNDNVTWFPLGDIHEHIINRASSGTSYIILDKNSITLGETVHILGYHPIGLNYAIFIGTSNQFDISAIPYFSEPYTPTVIGTYAIYLKEKINNVWITLDSVTLTVSKASTGGGSGNFSINIPTPYSYFIAIFVIILFTLSPLIILVSISKASGRDFNISSIPQFLYMICAIVGFILTILFLWLPSWTVAVLVILCILIIAILYMQKKNTSV